MSAMAEVARLLGDESRATMCTAMLDGRPWTVGELARAAGIGQGRSQRRCATRSWHGSGYGGPTGPVRWS
jgi:hypothetical protein